jgi:3-oxoacyl-[acyl-carrier-protein] synthase III
MYYCKLLKYSGVLHHLLNADCLITSYAAVELSLHCSGTLYTLASANIALMQGLSLATLIHTPSLYSYHYAIQQQPIGLSCFVSNGAACVFVCSDRPTVIYSRAGKVLYANVNSGGEVCMCNCLSLYYCSFVYTQFIYIHSHSFSAA